MPTQGKHCAHKANSDEWYDLYVAEQDRRENAEVALVQIAGIVDKALRRARREGE